MVAKGPYLLELCPFIGFQILPYLKIFEQISQELWKLESWKFV